MVAQWQIINRNYKNMDGYKRVAWPPVSEERVVREFTPQPTATHYPVSAGQQQPQPQQQQPAQQYQPQHMQQQQQQPQQQQHQPTHYQQQQQPSAAPTNQGAIYNNVSRAAHQYQQQVQKYYEPPKQIQESQQQQPIQYTQAQFNRQHSHEPAGTAYGQQVNGHYAQSQQQQLQQQYQPQNYPYVHEQQQQQQQQQQYDTNGPTDWKSIQTPVPKAHNEYPVGAVGGSYPSCGQQQQYKTSQQYRAASYDQYQQQPQYQYASHQGSSQPAYSAQSYRQQPNQQQQQQQPFWIQNQHALPYQSAQAPYQQAPQQQQQQQPYQAPLSSNYQAQAPYQSQYQAQPQTQYSNVPLSNQYNSYSQPQQSQQPQQQHVGQDQPDQRALPQDYRGGSPGIITLRKEAPMTQKPAPVYNAQPAAISLQGGSHLRGDLKWPPPEYKEAAARENEERRKLALGPVCRPRLVKKDYTQFFAKNAINSYYPSYKVPPGTQHMLA